ncbi:MULTISPECIES: hypothetical protein, partial [unclassified Caballeronia]|uniref:hypothetical protein n=1 Tax=unclassified Caballeronia TaxID=2646786 RepID=UPI0020291BD8
LSPIPKNQPHSPSSAHTYRLLVFKEHIARQALLQLPSCVAASAAEKRDYEERFGSCQQEFEVSFSCRSAPGAFYNLPPKHTADTALSRFLRDHRIAKERNSSERNRGAQALSHMNVTDA